MGKFHFIRFFIKIAVLACFIIAVGCANRPEPATSEISKGRLFFWKVSDENSSVWILGSIHFADSSFYPLDSVIENAFESAEELAVEINLSDDSVSGDVSNKMLQDGLLPKGTTLNSVLPRGLWKSLDSLCASWNFPVMALMRLRPWFAATTLSTVAIQRAGVQAEYGIDAVLMDRAVMDGKVIVGLETAADQVNALSGNESLDSSENQSDSAGIYYLKTTLREIANLDSMVAQMMRAWKTGNDSLLRVVMNEDSCAESSDGCENDSESEKKMEEELEERIYTKRNEKMAESIKNFLAEDRNVFVVIGAAHLVLDRNNVIELLRRDGLKVKRF